MKKVILILFALLLLLPAYAQDCYYHYRNRIERLTIDSTAVVLFTPSEQPNITALPRHFKLKESLPYEKCLLDVYEITLKKDKYNLADSKLFPKELPMMPCYRNTNGALLIPTGFINVMLKQKQDTCILHEVAKKFGIEVKRSYMNGYWYLLQIIPDKGNNSVDIANKLYDTGLFECAGPDFYDELILEISYDARTHDQRAFLTRK